MESVLSDSIVTFKGIMQQTYLDIVRINQKNDENIRTVMKATGTDPVKLNVGGRQFLVGKHVLTSVEGSLLSSLVNNIRQH